jgi:hypothetical protein
MNATSVKSLTGQGADWCAEASCQVPNGRRTTHRHGAQMVGKAVHKSARHGGKAGAATHPEFIAGRLSATEWLFNGGAIKKAMPGPLAFTGLLPGRQNNQFAFFSNAGEWVRPLPRVSNRL